MSLVLNTGARMPVFGLGTWKSKPGEVAGAVKAALAIGYRHFDCAWIYGNEAEIGEVFAEAFASGQVKREDLFITSKLWNTFHAPEDVRVALRETLTNLKLEYLDLYLVHWPVCLPKARDSVAVNVPIRDTWTAMEEIHAEGLAKAIGVSNFSVGLIRDMLSWCKVRPAVNQFERHPYLTQPELVSYCKSEGIVVTAYSPLGTSDWRKDFDPVLLEDETLKAIATANGKSAAQVLIRWAIQSETVVIPKSVNPGRLAENFDCQSWTLSAEDMGKLDGLNRSYRFVNPVGNWGIDPFAL